VAGRKAVSTLDIPVLGAAYGGGKVLGVCTHDGKFLPARSAAEN